jgi:HD-like signal output (HDOD) protein
MITFNLLNSDIKVPPMPSSGSKIMAMAQMPLEKIDIGAFCKLLEPDPGLFSMVLQLANSPFYRGVDEIVSLRAAITRIGLQEAINSVNFYFLKRFLPNLSELHGFSVKDYWAFSWTCAMAGRRLGHPNMGMNTLPGELYLAGLLHGIGKLLLAIYHPRQFFICVENARMLEQPLNNILQETFGTTDNIIASKLMDAWNLPPRICSAVEFYPDPDAAPEQHREIAGLTQFAYKIAAKGQIGNNGGGISADLESSWISQQTASPLSKKEFQEGVVQEILTSLELKSESVTGVSPSGKKAFLEPEPSMIRRHHLSRTTNRGPKPVRKGFMGWLQLLFR